MYLVPVQEKKVVSIKCNLFLLITMYYLRCRPVGAATQLPLCTNMLHQGRARSRDSRTGHRHTPTLLYRPPSPQTRSHLAVQCSVHTHAGTLFKILSFNKKVLFKK